MSLTERYRAYDSLAWFYDRYWGTQYHVRALPAFDRLVLSSLPDGARVLDLCCGAGHMTALLAGRGFQVTGIDGSEAMLAYARLRVPQGLFFAADARTFCMPAVFHAVVSSFESLNHLMSVPELEKVFAGVHASLGPGGLFAFDLLTEECYLSEWSKSSFIVEEDHLCLTRGGYSPSEKTGRTEITMFRLQTAWERSDVTFYQKCHDPDEVLAALEKSGFLRPLKAAAGDLSMEGRFATGRLFFRAEKEK